MAVGTGGGTGAAAAEAGNLVQNAQKLSNIGNATSEEMAEISLQNNMVEAFTNMMGQVGNNIAQSVK